jgi:hypothetical protein
MNRAITTRIAERRIAERRAARRRRRAEPPLELFDGIEWDDALIQAPRQRGDLVRLWRWIRRHQLPAQAVLIVGLLTVAYLLLIFGILLGRRRRRRGRDGGRVARPLARLAVEATGPLKHQPRRLRDRRSFAPIRPRRSPC